ncbi:MAG: DUF3025 domain-containing protein [Hydrogenophilaceae bacterium]|nr:DUF3025 domain-containing protein [Hydrogenophilaceae bacterium]
MTTPAWTPAFDTLPLCGSVAHWAACFRNAQSWPSTEQLNALAEAQNLRNAAGHAVRFAEQTSACGQLDYEQQILETGQVPTRLASAHDFFNALIWLTFPRTKAALNAVQCHELASAPKGQRSPASNAATLFDESGLVLVARDADLADLLRTKQWQAAFWEQRKKWHEARFYVIGHALMEKGLAPYPGMTGKCLFLQMDALPEAGPPPPALDAAIAEAWLNGAVTKPADLFVMPVLGVPGFDAANAKAAYYDNTEVFRPPRTTG